MIKTPHMIYEVWSFCWRTSRQLVQLGRCFWEPSCISHQKTSQQDRALLFPPSFLPQNDGCSFLLSDAPRRAAEQPQTIWQLWTQRANIWGSASPTNSLQIHPPLHLRLQEWLHPHKNGLQSKDFFPPVFPRSDASMRGTVGFFMTQTVWRDFSDVESILVLSQSPIWQ